MEVDMTDGQDGKKEPFIGSADRPEVKLDLDMPVEDELARYVALRTFCSF